MKIDSIYFFKQVLKKAPVLSDVAVYLKNKLIPSCSPVDSLEEIARSYNISVERSDDFLDFMRNDCVVRINKRHVIYGHDIIRSFDYYFSAVTPIRHGHGKLVDYSLPKYHKVPGYERSLILFPSFAEPLITTSQYLDFARLKKKDIVLDLGAYAGLTSIVFMDVVGDSGKVIAVEADKDNMFALKVNTDGYKKLTGNEIDILDAAVWNSDGHLYFSTEGNMGSAVYSVVGAGRGDMDKVKCYKLSDLVRMFSLNRVDLIKCDVEGAEQVIFEDNEFFVHFKPKIIVEPHYVGGKLTTEKFESDLKKHGYTFKKIKQYGVALPLVLCNPPCFK